MAKILIVDDSDVIRSRLHEILTKAGHLVIEAVDGLDGVSQASANQDVAAIITDYNMPHKNGVELIGELRKQAAFKLTPCIMLTTEAGTTLKKQGLEVGIKAWINKPIDEAMLLKVLDKLLSVRLAA